MGRPRKSDKAKLAAGTYRGERGSAPNQRYPINFGIRWALKHGDRTIRDIGNATLIGDRRLYSVVAGEAELMMYQAEILARHLGLRLVRTDWIKPEYIRLADGDAPEADNPEGSGPPTGSPSGGDIASSEPT